MKAFLRLFIVLILLLPIPAGAQSVTIGVVSGVISACAGTASVSPAVEQFSVSGTGLKGPITVQAPQNFEVSISAGSGYQSAVAIGPIGGQVAVTTLYVRSAATAPGGVLAGNCTVSTAGAAGQQVPVTASINALPTVEQVADQTITSGLPGLQVNFNGTGDVFNWVNDNPGIGLPASGTGNIGEFTAVNNTGKPIIAHFTVTPYFNGDAYVANNSALSAAVIDTHTDAVVDNIPVQVGPFGSTVSPDGSRDYISNAGSNSVSVISTASKTVLANVNVESVPYETAVSPDGSKVYVGNINGQLISVINASDFSVSTIAVGNNEVWQVILSPDGKTLFCTNGGNSVIFVDTITGQVIGQAPTDNFALGEAISPDGKTLYVTCYGGQDVSVIDVASRKRVQDITVGENPTDVTTSADGSVIYVTNENSNSVSVINAKQLTVTSTIPVGAQPFGLCITPDGKKLYVVNALSHDVSVVSLPYNYVLKTIPLGQGILTGAYCYGNFIAVNSCAGTPVTFTITVNPTPPVQVTTAGTLLPLSTDYGTASAATSFNFSATSINGNITVTAPEGFEVSTDGKSFKTAIAFTGGPSIGPVVIFIRLAATTHGGIWSGNITIAATGATTVNVAMPASTVRPVPLTIQADDKSKAFELPDPPFTATYTGFVNNDSPASLDALPILSTTAFISSPPGQYPIDITGASSTDYTITMLPGVLTIVSASSIVIPNAFTPNGDGINDTWIINDLDLFPNCTVNVFSRYGQKVYASVGYGVPWDGTRNGAILPTGTYYYVIDLKNGLKILSGYVVILR